MGPACQPGKECSGSAPSRRPVEPFHCSLAPSSTGMISFFEVPHYTWGKYGKVFLVISYHKDAQSDLAQLDLSTSFLLLSLSSFLPFWPHHLFSSSWLYRFLISSHLHIIWALVSYLDGSKGWFLSPLCHCFPWPTVNQTGSKALVGSYHVPAREDTPSPHHLSWYLSFTILEMKGLNSVILKVPSSCNSLGEYLNAFLLKLQVL